MTVKQINFDEQLKRLVEYAGKNYNPDAENKQPRIKSVCLPQLPNRLIGFEPCNSKSKQWTALYNNIKKCVLTGCLIAIHGKRGCGKSQIGVCLIRYCCKNGKTALYKKSMDMFLKIRMAMKTDGGSEYTAIKEYIKPFLLVIDAFEVRGDTAFEDRLLNHIIDKRYDDMKSTIIISNDGEEKFINVLGNSIMDRMRETGGMVSMDWKSFRNVRVGKDKV